MKAYKLTATTRELSERKLSCLSLGEKGRGRIETLIPCPEGIKDGEAVETALSQTGRPKIVRGERNSENWLARVSTDGAYIRGANGNIRAPKGANVSVIARGHGAFGDAGRIGDWDDLLLIVPTGTILRVKPTRGSAYLLFFEEERVVQASAEEALAFDREIPPCESEDPAFKEAWVRL